MEDEGPWQRLDPAKLRAEAETRAAKLKRQQEQRLMRTEARREKRHAKADAKKARRSNVQHAAKWTTERRAADKQKKLALRPHKKEKRRIRMRSRAEKLEAQARALWAEAQKARALADVLDEQKAKEDEEKNQLKNEIEAMARDPENDNYIPLDGDSDTNEDPTVSNNETAQDIEDTKMHDVALHQAVEGEAEAEKKRKRKEEKRAEKRKRETAGEDEEGAEEAPAGTTNVDAEAESETKIRASKEKRKKRKTERTSDDEKDNDKDDGCDAKSPTTKKDKKKKKSRNEHGAAENDADDQAETDDAPKDKKHEKKKKKKKKKEKHAENATGELASAPTDEQKADTNGGAQWNVSALEGDSKRKQKFLRLLGGKKAGEGAGDGHTTSASSQADIAKMQSDLERQFDVGIKMKQEGHSRRKGLGA